MGKKFLIGCSIVFFVVLGILFIIFMKGVGYYNRMVALDQDVKAKWGQVENVYQRRYDLIPNLVETVKGYAKHEKETLQGVIDARSKVGGVINLPEKAFNDPEQLRKFQEAQNSLSGALQRLMIVVEKYPDLKANQNFLELQSQLEGTENRIAVERRNFNEAAMAYNTYIKTFPQNFIANMFGFKEKAYFQAETGADKAPKVQF